MRNTKIVLLTLLCALPLAAQIDQEVRREMDHFNLFNACRPMDLTIEHLHDYATAIGLTREALQAAAESRLRAARLYSGDYEKTGFAYLYVQVSVVDQAYAISVRYNKRLTDEFGISGWAVTWVSGSTGMHGRSAGYIMSSLSRHLDKFLASYLRVNESACESR